MARVVSRAGRRRRVHTHPFAINPRQRSGGATHFRVGALIQLSLGQVKRHCLGCPNMLGRGERDIDR